MKEPELDVYTIYLVFPAGDHMQVGAVASRALAKRTGEAMGRQNGATGWYVRAPHTGSVCAEGVIARDAD